jgi:hypothetical protein
MRVTRDKKIVSFLALEILILGKFGERQWNNILRKGNNILRKISGCPDKCNSESRRVFEIANVGRKIIIPFL